MRKWFFSALLFAAMGCTRTYSTFTDTTKPPSQASQSLVDYLRNNYSFSIFYAGLQRAGLDKQILPSGTYTLLTPDNDAFARAGITQDSVMSMDTAALRQWLGFHIIQGAIAYDSVPQTIDNVYFSILGQKIFFSRPIPTRGASAVQIMHIDGVPINSFDIPASNGFIQVLNTPLNAPIQGTLQDYINAHPDQYSLFKHALQHFNLWDQLADTSSQLTVFAPVDSDFVGIQYFSYAQQTYLSDTITPAVIDSWDTRVIPRAIFEVYFVPSRIFTSDFSDAPANTGPSGTYASYILPDQTAAVYLSGQGQPSFNAQLLTPYQYQLKAQNSGNLRNPGNLVTLNGNSVLQSIDQLTLVP